MENNQTNTEVTKTITSLDEINNIIKRKEVGYACHFFVPSLNKEIPFNEINTAQQKRLVKSVIDSPVYNTEFIYTLHGILRENCMDPDVNINDLTIIDKLILAISMRIKSIGDKAEISIETKDGTEVSVSLELPKILQLALATMEKIEDGVFEDQYYVVTCSLPTVGLEYQIERELRADVVDIEIDDIKELRETIGDAFTGELVKYVKDITVKGDGDEMIQVDWHGFSIPDRIKVIESFRTPLLKQVLAYINQVRGEIDKIELVKFEFGGETYERRLSIDGGFFTIS